MVYVEKRAEAETVIASPNPEGVSVELAPHICREAQARGRTKFDVAVEILTLAEAWRTVSPVIETPRLSAKEAVRTAETAEAVEAAATITWPAP